MSAPASSSTFITPGRSDEGLQHAVGLSRREDSRQGVYPGLSVGAGVQQYLYRLGSHKIIPGRTMQGCFALSFLTLMSAPASNRACSNPGVAKIELDAESRGVQPSLSPTLTSAPASSRTCSTAGFLVLSIARNRLLFFVSWLTPALNSTRITSGFPLYPAAQCKRGPPP